MFDNSNMSNTNAVSAKASTPREFGQQFRAEREARGMTQQDLATAINRRRQAIGDIEDGKNVGLITVFMALAAMGKCVEIKSSRLELENIESFLRQD